MKDNSHKKEFMKLLDKTVKHYDVKHPLGPAYHDYQ